MLLARMYNVLIVNLGVTYLLIDYMSSIAESIQSKTEEKAETIVIRPTYGWALINFK